MIKMISVKCPECGANISIENDRKFCFCQYCGTKVMMDDGSATYTYRKVDEARIKEAELKQAVRLKELEIEENKRQAAEKTKMLKIKASIILAIVGVIFLIIGFVGGSATGDPDSPVYAMAFVGLFALMAIFFIWITGVDKK